MFTVSFKCVLFALLLSSTWTTARLDGLPDDFSFGTGDFSCDGKGPLWCGGRADSNSGVLRLVSSQGDVERFSDTGMVVMNVPIPLYNNITNQWVSFHTQFQFSITPSTAFGPGDGMTFVLLNVPQFPDEGGVPGTLYPGAPGPGFGLYDDLGQQVVTTLAVEFDIFENHEDTGFGSNHVGVDLETRVHKIAKNASEVGVQLASSSTVYVWITYHSSSRNLDIRINSSESAPIKPFLEYKVNLSSVFGADSEIYLGFTASNGYSQSFSSYVVTRWSVSIFDAVDASGSAPAPAGGGSSGPPDVGVLVGIIASAAVVALILLALVICWTKRWLGQRTLDLELGAYLRYTYTQLRAATDNFSENRKLGGGGFGTVYRGVIRTTGRVVAVKRVHTHSRQGIKEFVAEVKIINELRHRNVVRLHGWCMEKNKLLLVYEYMPNGSLDKVLFDPAREEAVLSWDFRWRISVGVAEGLHYLHEGWRQQIIHRDIKASNVMLDDDFNAFLGDFGLARMIDRQDHTTGVSTVVAGTFGYMAQEVAANCKFTTKSDVYAFGAVALEIACGRAAYNRRLPEDQMLLVDWVWKHYEEDEHLNVVDPRLKCVFIAQQVELLLLVGLLCSHPNPDCRPRMRQVLEILAGSVALPTIPRLKPPFDFRQERQLRHGSQELSSFDSSTSMTMDMSTCNPSKIKSTTSASSTQKSEESTPIRRCMIDVRRVLNLCIFESLLLESSSF